MLIEWLSWLDSFVFIYSVESIIINVGQVTWIVFETLVPSDMRDVEESIHVASTDQFKQGSTVIRKKHVSVLDHSLVNTTRTVGSTQSSVYSVPVGSPHVSNSVVNAL